MEARRRALTGVPVEVRSGSFADLDPTLAYRLWALRSQVFVVEQNCPYLDLDGRDLEPGTTHLWVEDVGLPVAYLRVLTQPGGEPRIGRVVTAPLHRGRGLAAALMHHAVELGDDRPSALDAQSYLEGWYEQFGYRRSGPDFLEDGILHTPMVRP